MHNKYLEKIAATDKKLDPKKRAITSSIIGAAEGAGFGYALGKINKTDELGRRMRKYDAKRGKVGTPVGNVNKSVFQQAKKKYKSSTLSAKQTLIQAQSRDVARHTSVANKMAHKHGLKKGLKGAALLGAINGTLAYTSSKSHNKRLEKSKK